MGEKQQPTDRAGKEEDRISDLPDDLLHHILSLTEIKIAAQTCVLSWRWHHVWASLPDLNFSRSTPRFSEFVSNFLSKRNQYAEISTIDLDYRSKGYVFAKSIIEVAGYLVPNNVHQLSIVGTYMMTKILPCSIFSSPSLKKLTLNFNNWDFDKKSLWSLPALTYLELHNCSSPGLAWSFPSLTTLHLRNCKLPLMSWAMPNLRTLHLDSVTIPENKLLNVEKFIYLENLAILQCKSPVDIFSITSLSLAKLTIHSCWAYPTHKTRKFVVSAPKLTCINYWGYFPLVLCADDGLPSLENVNMDIGCGSKEALIYRKKKVLKKLLKELVSLFEAVRTAKFLTLCVDDIEVLSRAPEFLGLQPSPFCNLKCLKLSKRWTHHTPTIPVHVESYFLGSSPTAAVVIEDNDRIIRYYNIQTRDAK